MASESALAGRAEPLTYVMEGRLIVNKTRGDSHRQKLRQQFWPDDHAWTGENEKGWFSAPRTLPLVLALLASKELSGKCDPTRVYLELWSRHMSSGIIEMAHEGEHAYAAGYIGPRGNRTWQERMGLLQKLGFIKPKQIGNQRYRYVLLVHPTAVLARLSEEVKIPTEWWDTYRARQIETGQKPYEEKKKAKRASKVVPMVPAKPAQKKAGG